MLLGGRSGVLLPVCLHMAAAADGMARFSCGIGGRDLLRTWLTGRRVPGMTKLRSAAADAVCAAGSAPNARGSVWRGELPDCCSERLLSAKVLTVLTPP